MAPSHSKEPVETVRGGPLLRIRITQEMMAIGALGGVETREGGGRVQGYGN